jgi:hypothetical protein
LNIYEGKDYETKTVKYNPEESLDMFLKYLENLILEICGSNDVFIVNVNSLKILSILRGLQSIQVSEQRKAKSNLMNCMTLCKKIIAELNAIIAEAETTNELKSKDGDQIGL